MSYCGHSGVWVKCPKCGVYICADCGEIVKRAKGDTLNLHTLKRGKGKQ